MHALIATDPDTALFYCPHAQSGRWKLGRQDAAKVGMRMGLIGWRRAPGQVEEGVPRAVEQVLAHALTSVGRVTFLCSRWEGTPAAAWTTSPADQVRRFSAKGVGTRLRALLNGVPTRGLLVSTQQPAMAAELFDDLGYPWRMGGQLVLLSPRGAMPPELDERMLFRLRADDWVAYARWTAPDNLLGILRPGVAGALAGAVFLNEATEHAFVAELERCTRAASYGWAIVTEAEFKKKLAARKRKDDAAVAAVK